MASPIKVKSEQWLNLRVLSTDLLPKYEWLVQYSDGMITFQDRLSLERAYVHWYELIFDALFPALARREAEKDQSQHWESYYIKYITQLAQMRSRLKLGKHPIDFLFENYQRVMFSSERQTPVVEG